MGPRKVGRSEGKVVIDVRAGKLLPALLAAAVVLTACTGSGAGSAGSSAPTDTSSDSAGLGSAGLGNPSPTESLTGPADSAAAEPTLVPPTLTSATVPLAPGVADEASGIAASTTSPGAYYLIDDGTGTDAIVAVGTDGQLIASIAVDGLSADNAEALTAGTCGTSPLPTDPQSAASQTQNCLYVGDIGDNAERRDNITVVRFAEADLTAPPTDPVPADQWRYTYPDGPHNAEAMLVDSDGSLLIVTKPAAQGALPHRMYRAEPGGGELIFLREFSPPPSARPLKTLFTGNVVTDLAAAPGRVLLLTYDDVQEYLAPDPTAELASFPDWPHHPLLMPAVPQAEGITPTATGCGYTVASEAGPGGKKGWLGLVTCG